MEIEQKIKICNPNAKQFIMEKDKEVTTEMKLMFHPEVPTGSHVKTYKYP